MMLLANSFAPPNLSYLLFFLSIVVLWAMTRPGIIRDEDHRRNGGCAALSGMSRNERNRPLNPYLPARSALNSSAVG